LIKLDIYYFSLLNSVPDALIKKLKKEIKEKLAIETN
jgi:hypothetical protein